jgi:RTX calcium-binding nonapeptide repeat (4 copies)
MRSRERMFRMRVRAGLVTAAVTAAVFLPVAASAAPSECFGKKPTIEGDGGDERIKGTSGPDVIMALGGNDHILGRGGRDRICAGRGNDVIGGQGGKDVLGGQAGNDKVYGGGGSDRLFAGGGVANDLLGNKGDDLLRGGPGFERLFGQAGSDLLLGAAGIVDRAVFIFSDRRVRVDLGAETARGEGQDALRQVEDIEGSRHDDLLYGDRVPNWFFPRAGADRVDGRGSTGDLVSLDGARNPVHATMEGATGHGADEFARIEGLQGSRDFGDDLSGNELPNLILGIGGPDDLSGFNDDDRLDGGQGSDSADGGPHVFGDRCIEIEDPVNCEFGEATALRAGSLPEVWTTRRESAILPAVP